MRQPARLSAPVRLVPIDVLVAAALGAVAISVALLRLVPGVNPTTAGFVLLIVVLLTATRRTVVDRDHRRGRIDAVL